MGIRRGIAMVYSAKVVQVMIAGPSDAVVERKVAEAVIHRWNATSTKADGVVLLPVAWDTHSIPDLSQPAQDQIDNQVLAEADILIAIFNARAGTPTSTHLSATMQEIDTQLRAGKGAMVYFRREPSRDGVDDDQRQRLAKIKADCMSRGRIGEYDSVEGFTQDLREQLTQFLRISERLKGLLRAEPHQVAVRFVPAPSASEALSGEARALLYAAAHATSPGVLRTRTLVGNQISAGAVDFCPDGDERAAAKWDAALEELEHHDLMRAAGTKRQVFDVTHKGYELADRLAPDGTPDP